MNTPQLKKKAAPAPVTGPTSRPLAASLLGTTLENYDFYLYGTAAALVFNKVFFPDLDATAGVLASFLVFATAFLVRPAGAVLFGHLGDTYGRKRTLVWTLGLMGVSTGLIGLLPSHASIGVAAPLLLTLLRCLQGLSMGGEWGGGILIASEHAPANRRALWAAVPQIGSPVGTIASSFVFVFLTATLSEQQFLDWGWRVPFLLAIPFTAVALYIRTRVEESPEFEKNRGRLPRRPAIEFIRSEPVKFAAAVAASVLAIGSYFLLVTYTMAYGTETLGLSETTLLNASIAGSLLQLLTIPLFGVLAVRVGSATMVALGAGLTLLLAFPLYALMSTATAATMVACMLLGGIFPTMCWAALGGMMSDLFDSRTRYTALSVSYSVAAVVAGFVPALTAWLGGLTGSAWWHPALVLAGMSALSLAGALYARVRSAASATALPAPAAGTAG